MNETKTKTVTLQEFLSERAICRVWWAGVADPAGAELVLDLEDDGEDYCDSETMLDLPFVEDALDLDGLVTVDRDGENRWTPNSLADADLRDQNGNTVYNLVVWGERRWTQEQVVAELAKRFPDADPGPAGLWGFVNAGWGGDVDEQGCGDWASAWEDATEE